MANEDVIRLRGSGKEYKDDRGGATLIPSAVLGIVKNNIDPTHSGRIEVFLKRLGSSDPDNPAFWTTVRYLSPFFGYTPNTGNPDGHGEYVGNPNSYGFWATPPDIGTEVVCVFLNGDPNEGFYVGGVPRPGQTQMVPGIGAADNIIANSGEAQSYGGASRLPVGESNNANPKQANALDQTNQPRPIHSYQSAIYNKQGLLRDPDRGPISSSSMRESPSRVFGISTPGRPIYNGGYTDQTIASAASSSSASAKSFQVIGRTGGHTVVMDDGDVNGKDQLLRLRTSTGHTILMNDTAQTLFIIHANGQSYIELGKEGTIDMYSTNSVNIRTQGDLNLHADNNINMFAGKDFNVNAQQNVQIESEKQTNMFAGTNFAQSVKGSYTNKVEGGMSLASGGAASFAASGAAYVNGAQVNLNTGSSSLVPQAVKQLNKVKHTETLYDGQKGFIAAPGKLTSVASRVPAHTPWADANKGVNVQTNLNAEDNFPKSASSAVTAVNNSVPASPAVPTTPAVASTVPNIGTSTSIDKVAANTLTSQMAVNAATNPATADAVKQTAGIATSNGTSTAVLGATAMTPEQLVATGHIKPGMETAINAAIASGKSLSDAIPPTAWTGKDGINNTDEFLNSKGAQVSATQTLLDKSKTSLVQAGVLTGKESIPASGSLILATASAGTGPVMDYLKKVANTTVAGLTSALPPGTLSSVNGTISNLLASGKAASGLADKVMSGNPAIDTSSPEGVSKGLFDKIKESFKPLTAGVPLSLSAANSSLPVPVPVPGEAAELAAAASKVTGGVPTSTGVVDMLKKAYSSASATVSSLTSSIPKLGTSESPTGLDNLPGGTQAVSSLVESGNPMKIPGIGSIKDSLAKVTGAASGAMSSVTEIANGLKAKVGEGMNLSSFASLGLKSDDLAKLSSSINSVAAGGSAQVQLPTVAEGTNNTSSLAAQSANLLGNPKIPPLSFGSSSSGAPTNTTST